MTPRPALVIVLVAALADTIGAQPAAEMWTTDALVARATAGHPSIAAAAADARRTEADARQGGAWPNPRVDYLAENLRRAGGDPRAQHTVLVEQPILLGGKLKLSRGALTHATASASANAAAVATSVANAVRLRAVEVRLAEARLALGRRVVAYAEDAEDIARQLFNTGVVDQPDVLAAEAEAEIMRLRLAVAETVREQTWQQLALAVGDPALPRRPLADDPPVVLDRAEALAAILSAHPSLAAARADTARAEAARGPRRRRSRARPDDRRGSAVLQRTRRARRIRGRVGAGPRCRPAAAAVEPQSGRHRLGHRGRAGGRREAARQ